MAESRGVVALALLGLASLVAAQEKRLDPANFHMGLQLHLIPIFIPEPPVYSRFGKRSIDPSNFHMGFGKVHYVLIPPSSSNFLTRRLQSHFPAVISSFRNLEGSRVCSGPQSCWRWKRNPSVYVGVE